MAALTLDDDGMLELTIDAVSQTIDAYQVQNRVYELCKEFADKPAQEFHAAVVALLQELGFPPCSHRLADRFVAALNEHVEGLKKKPDPGGVSTPASPGSTA